MDIKLEVADIKCALESIVGKFELAVETNAIATQPVTNGCPQADASVRSLHDSLMWCTEQNEVLRKENAQLKESAAALKDCQAQNEHLTATLTKLSADLAAVRVQNIDLKSRCEANARTSEMSPRSAKSPLFPLCPVMTSAPSFQSVPSSMQLPPGSPGPPRMSIQSKASLTSTSPLTQAGVLFSTAPGKPQSVGVPPGPSRQTAPTSPTGGSLQVTSAASAETVPAAMLASPRRAQMPGQIGMVHLSAEAQQKSPGQPENGVATAITRVPSNGPARTRTQLLASSPLLVVPGGSFSTSVPGASAKASVAAAAPEVSGQRSPARAPLGNLTRFSSMPSQSGSTSVATPKSPAPICGSMLVAAPRQAAVNPPLSLATTVIPASSSRSVAGSQPPIGTTIVDEPFVLDIQEP